MNKLTAIVLVELALFAIAVSGLLYEASDLHDDHGVPCSISLRCE